MHICVTNASSKTQELSCWPFWVHLYHFLRSKHQWATVLTAQAQHCRLPEIGPIQPTAWIWFSYDLWSKIDFLNYWMIVRKSNILQHVKITWDSNFSACNNILSACLPPHLHTVCGCSFLQLLGWTATCEITCPQSLKPVCLVYCYGLDKCLLKACVLKFWFQETVNSLRSRIQARNTFGHIRHALERNAGTLTPSLPFRSLDLLKGAANWPRYVCHDVCFVFPNPASLTSSGLKLIKLWVVGIFLRWTPQVFW